MKHIILFFSLLTVGIQAKADQMAIWNFGPNAAGYTEVVTTHFLNTAPTLAVSGALKDANGKDGVAYTDTRGIFHALGQAAAWDDTDNLSTAAQILITLDTTGWQDLTLGFNYLSEPGEVDEYDLHYRIGTAGAWTLISDNAALLADGVWHRLDINLSSIAAIENAGAIQFLISDLDDDGNNSDVDELRFDNVEITGSNLGGPAIDLVTTEVTDGPFVSGVINDATDPVATIGVSFTISHPVLPPGSLAVTVSSSDPAVVPNDSGHLVLTHSGADVTLRVLAVNRGYSTVRVTVSDGVETAFSDLSYAATFNGTPTPNAYIYGSGFSDASTAIALDANFMLVANDEIGINNCCLLNTPGPQIFLMERQFSGRAVRTFDFTPDLILPDANREVDVEGSTRIGNRIYWVAALGNNKDGECRPNRNRIFATDIFGTGANTQLGFWGYYQFLREDLILWDVNAWHGKTANYYGFQAGAYCAPTGGNPPKIINGFNVEGLAMAPDGTTAYVGFRSPLTPAVPGGRALIVPIKNFPAWFAQVDGFRHVTHRLTASDFGPPIELNLNGRSIRSIEANSLGEYLIVAGSYGDTEDTPGLGLQLYRWSGNPKDTNPYLIGDLPNPVPQPLFVGHDIQSGAYEGIATIPFPLNGSIVDLILDNGRSKWYRDTDDESKTLPGGHQRFAREAVALPAPGTLVATGAGGGSAGVCVTDDGTVYSIKDIGQIGYVYALRANDLSTKWSYMLNSTAPYNAFTQSPAVGTDGVLYAGTKDYLHAINPDGTQRWAFNLGGRRIRSNIALGADGTIYVCANDGTGVRAFAIWPNGTQRWQYNMGSGTATTVALGENALYAANEDGGGIYAIDPQTGTLIWQVHPPSSSEPETVTVAADGTIYVTGEDNNLTALNPNGTTKWVYNTPNSVDGDIVIGNDGMIYLADNNGNVLAIRSNGTLAWLEPDVHTSCSSGLTLGPDGTLYLASCDASLTALSSADGTIKWTTTTDQVYFTSRPAISQNGLLYLHTRTGTVALYANSGWSPDAHQTAMGGYAASSWPTSRRNPFGTGQAVAGQPALLEASWKVTKSPLAASVGNQAVNEAQGYHFTPLVNGEISALGGCFAGTKVLKLFNRGTGALLGEAQVSDLNNWSYLPITPVVVNTNTSYTVAAYLTGSGGSIVYDTAFPRNSQFVRIDGATRVDTSIDSEAIPTSLITTGEMYGQADIKFRPYSVPIWAPISTLTTTNIAWQYVMGFHFTPQKDGWVTDLGGLFNGTKVMKLFDRQSGKVLASNLVASANSYAYAPITPLPVKQGSNYTVAVYLAGSGGSYSQYSSTLFPRTNNNVIIQATTYAIMGTNDFSIRPTNSYLSYMYGQADIKFVPKN